MNDRYPQDSGVEALEGEAAHWCNTQDNPGPRAPNGVAITDEMLKGREMWRAATSDGDYSVFEQERQFVGKSIHETLNFGTPDAYGLSDGALHIFDYKFGFGQVEVFENWQLINYAALVLENLGVSDLSLSVRFVIVQPRGHHRDGPVREWHLPQAALLRGHWNQLRAAAKEATTPERVRGTVGPQCKHCPGRHSCEALQRNTLRAIDEAGSSVPLDMPLDAISTELRSVRRAIKLMEAREAGLSQHAKHLMLQGQRSEFFVLEQSQGNPRWALPSAQIIALGRTLGLDLSITEVITPSQARKLGMPADIVDSLAYRQLGEMRLVEDTGEAVRKLFRK